MVEEGSSDRGLEMRVLNLQENNFNNNVQEIDFGPYLLENFMRYADSVVTDRALPDIRDGVKNPFSVEYCTICIY